MYKTTRRHLLALAASATATQVLAKDPPKVVYLAAGRAPSSLDRAFIAGLRSVGMVEGADLIVESRFGLPDQLAEDAKAAVDARVAVIVTAGPLATAAAVKATSTIPIVCLVADPVSSGFVRNYNRPEGNVTGLSFLGTELAGKRAEILGELLPGIRKVAILYNEANRGSTQQATSHVAALRESKLVGELFDIGLRGSLTDAALRGKAWGAEAGIVLSQGQNIRPEDGFLFLAQELKLPCMFVSRPFVENGALISYGPDLLDIYSRAAQYVHKLMNGAKVADLPVEGPRKFELALNTRTAAALGLRLPEAIVAMADYVRD